MLTFQKKETINESDKAEWLNLWEHARLAHSFNSPYWYEACRDTFPGKYCCYFVYSDGRKLVAVLPFCVKFGHIYVSPGNRYIDKDSNLFSDSSEGVWESFARMHHGKLYLIKEVPEPSLQYYRNLCFKKYSSINPYATIDGSLTTISRRTFKTIQSIIQKNSALSFRVFSGNDLESNLSIMFDIEEKSNKVKRRKAIFDKANIRKLYREMCAYPGARLFVLYYENEPIAHSFDFINKSYIMGYHTAYVDAYKQLTPGKLVTYYVMKFCLENGLKKYDFSRGDCQKKRQFAKADEDHYDLYYSDILILRFFLQAYLLCLRCLRTTKAIIKKYYKKNRSWLNKFFNKKGRWRFAIGRKTRINGKLKNQKEC